MRGMEQKEQGIEMKRVAVVGLGPAGLLISALLAQNGTFKVVGFDAREEECCTYEGRTGKRSSLSITVNERGLRALREASVDVEDAPNVNGAAWPGHKVVHARSLKSVKRKELAERIKRRCEELSVDMHFGRKVDVQELEKLKSEFDLVIGADGTNSNVRLWMWGEPDESCGPCENWSLLQGQSVRCKVLKECFHVGYAQVVSTIPVNPGMENMLQLQNMQTVWKDSFVIALPTSSSDLDVGLYGPPEMFQNNNAIRMAVETLTNKSINNTSENLVGSYEPLNTILTLDTLKENVILIGDAASTRLPFLGCGANLALEDAFQLYMQISNGLNFDTLRSWANSRVVEHEVACRISKEEAFNFLKRMEGSKPFSDKNGNEVQFEYDVDDLFHRVQFSTIPLADVVEADRMQLGINHQAPVCTTSSGLKVYVSEGDSVNKGQVIGVLETIKTRRVFRAQATGNVKSVEIKGGTSVTADISSCASPVSNVSHIPRSTSVVENPCQDVIDTAQLQEFLSEQNVEQFGRFTNHQTVTTSTMDDAKREIGCGTPVGSLFLAEKQVKGRGRGGRAWKSDLLGNIYMSLVVRPFPGLSLAVPCAVALALRSLGISNASVKWPNDVYVGGTRMKKVSGMLIEEDALSNMSVVGIGINVLEQFAEDSLATSVCDVLASQGEIVKPFIREKIIAAICARLEAFSKERDPVSTAMDSFKEVDMLLGRTVVITNKQGKDVISILNEGEGNKVQVPSPFVAVARGLDIYGRLRVSSSQFESAILQDSECSVSLTGKQILVYSGPGADERCRHMTVRMLSSILPQYISREILPNELTDPLYLWEEECALLVLPGGADIPMKKSLGEVGQRRIKHFVEEKAGKYLGFCAGAYFGCSKVEFDLHGPLEVNEPRILAFFPGTGSGPALPGFQYSSPKGAWASRLDAEGPLVGKVVYSYFNGGCRFVLAEDHCDNTRHVEVLARYHRDASVAIVKCCGPEQGDSKRCGIAILCGPHPEFDPDSDDWPEEGQSPSPLGPDEDVPYGAIHSTLNKYNVSRKMLLEYLLLKLELE